MTKPSRTAVTLRALVVAVAELGPPGGVGEQQDRPRDVADAAPGQQVERPRSHPGMNSFQLA